MGRKCLNLNSKMNSRLRNLVLSELIKLVFLFLCCRMYGVRRIAIEIPGIEGFGISIVDTFCVEALLFLLY